MDNRTLDTTQEHVPAQTRSFFSLGKIINAVCVLFFVGGAALLVATTKTNLPGNFQVLSVLSGSMRPTFSEGSLILSRANPQGTYRTGDIIVFKTPSDVLVTHRVQEVVPEGSNQVRYRTKGDANDAADPDLVAPEQVRGVVFFWVPFLGRVVSFVKSPYGFVLFIVLPALYIIFSEIFTIRDEIMHHRGKKKAQLMIFILLFGAYLINTITPVHAYFSPSRQSTENAFTVSESFP